MRSYSPLRYPGGKVRLYPYIKEVIKLNFSTPPIYIEGFAGGAGLALKLLSKGIVKKIYLNDYDYAINCIWYSLKYHNEEFITLIETADLTITEWNKQKRIYLNSKDKSANTKLEVGFATFYLNRTNRSGIITAGPIGGKNQDGNYKMDCRFNKKELVKIVKNFNLHKKNIHVYNRDAYKFIQYIDSLLLSKNEEAFFYLDPPYVQKGPELYKNSFNEKKHKQLCNAIKNLNSKWFVTYDDNDLISDIYSDYNMHPFELSYVMQTAKKGRELAIFSDNVRKPSKIKL